MLHGLTVEFTTQHQFVRSNPPANQTRRTYSSLLLTYYLPDILFRQTTKAVYCSAGAGASALGDGERDRSRTSPLVASFLGEALRLRSGDALRLRSGDAERLRSGEADRLRAGDALRLRGERLKSGSVHA